MSPRKMLRVALRDFLATAATKGFIIGAVVVPFLMLGVLLAIPFLINEDAPPVEGRLALLDRSDEVAQTLVERLAPEALVARRSGERERVREEIAELGVPAPGEAVDEALAQAEGVVPTIHVDVLPAAADLEAEKAVLREEDESPAARLALLVVDEDAVSRAPGATDWGGFQLWVRHGLDDRVQDEIRAAVRTSIRDRRVLAAGLDPPFVESLTEVDSPPIREVTAEGEREALGELRMFVSFGFMGILLIAVLVGGQSLLTTTIEEKSSRVVEVLLSALSPMELMAGKIFGQLAVALTLLVLYTGIGGGALASFGLADLLGPGTFAAMVVFFLIAYMTVGALMAAIGSAVNDLREAQSLQTPIMLALFVPYMLWFPISRDPSSLFATVCSLVPPVNSFVMMLRITSTEPPPAWQVVLSIVIGLVGVWLALWAAAKVFRVGLLMFGKPPNLRTLARWVRQA